MAEENTEKPETEEAAGIEIGNIGNLFSPEAVIMFSVAIILDIVGIICTILIFVFGISEIISWISDIVGMIIFGLWLLMKMAATKIFAGSEEVASETTKITEKGEAMVSEIREKREALKKAKAAAAKVKTAARPAGKRGLRFLVAFIGEIIPIIGTLPFWTWFVYSELKGQD